MNKKVLSALLFGALMVGTGTFTSCIDNEEPDGITTLRDAKAALLLAKAEVEKANASYIEAQKALIDADVKIKEAKADWEEANAKVKDEEAKQAALETALAEAKNEVEIAKLKAELEMVKNNKVQAELDAEKAQKQFEIDMMKLNAQLAEAQADYEEAMKNLDLAKVSLTSEQKTALEAANQQVSALKAALDQAQSDLLAAQQAYFNAITDVDYDTQLKMLALKVEKAEHELAHAEAAAEQVAEYAGMDLSFEEWLAEADKKKDEISELSVQLAGLDVERVKLEEANKDALDAAKKAVTDAKAAIKAAKDEKYELKAYKKTIENQAVVGLYGEDEVSYDAGEFSVNEPDVADEALAALEDAIDKLGKLSISKNEMAQYELALEGYEKAVENAEKAYNDAVADWEIALLAFTKGEKTDVPATDFNKAVEAYNAALEALNTAAKAYNDAYKAAYEAAYDKALAGFEQKLSDELLLAAMDKELKDLGYGVDIPNKDSKNYTVEFLKGLYETDDDKKALAETEKAVAKEVAKQSIDLEETWVADAKAAAETEAGKVKTEAVEKAVAAAQKAYDAVAPALNKHVEKVGGTYAQVLTDAAKKITVAAETGVGAKVKIGKTEYTIAEDEWTKKDDANYVVVRTAIAKAKAEAMVETKVDATLAEAAWKDTSLAAFGVDNRYVALEKDDLGTITEGALYAWVVAEKELAVKEGQLAANDDIDALIEELNAQMKEVKDAVEAAENVVAVAEKAKEDAEDAEVAKNKEIFGEIDEEVKNLNAEIASATNIMNALKGAVSAAISQENFYYSYNNVKVTFDPAEMTFEDFLTHWALAEKENVIKKQADVDAAKEAKDFVENGGEFNALAMAEIELAKAEEAFEAAKYVYNLAYEQLKRLIATILTE